MQRRVPPLEESCQGGNGLVPRLNASRRGIEPFDDPESPAIGLHFLVPNGSSEDCAPHSRLARTARQSRAKCRFWRAWLIARMWQAFSKPVIAGASQTVSPGLWASLRPNGRPRTALRQDF